MGDPLAAAKVTAEKAYNAAAESFDAEPLTVWARYGQRTVERLSLHRVKSDLRVASDRWWSWTMALILHPTLRQVSSYREVHPIRLLQLWEWPTSRKHRKSGYRLTCFSVR